jgi:hypothetical protein
MSIAVDPYKLWRGTDKSCDPRIEVSLEVPALRLLEQPE